MSQFFWQCTRCLLNEFTAVSAGDIHKVVYFVAFYSPFETCEGVRIEIVGPDEDSFLGCRDSEGSYPRHNIADGFSFVEFGDKTFVFCGEAGIIVDFAKVESEFAACFMNGHVKVVQAGEDFIRKGAEFGFRADVFYFVDHRSDAVVLVEKNLADQMAVGQILCAQVDMC